MRRKNPSNNGSRNASPYQRGNSAGSKGKNTPTSQTRSNNGVPAYMRPTRNLSNSKINLLRYRLENSLHQTTLVSEITLTNHLNSDKIQIQDNLQIKDKTLTIELPAITGQIVDQSLLMGQRQCSHTSLNLFHLQIQGGSLCMRDSMVKVGQPE